MKLEATAAFLLIVLILGVIIYKCVEAFRSTKLDQKQWVLHIEESQDTTEFWLVRGATSTHFIGRARRSACDYTDKLIELQSIAEETAIEWNAANKVLNHTK